MEKLIKDSINAIKPLDEVKENLIYTWIIDAICYLPELRDKNYDCISKNFNNTLNYLTYIINHIKTKEDIYFYRGLNDEPVDLIILDTITSITHKKDIAKDFGDYVIKILIPKGSNAFFISAIDIIKKMKNIKKESEFETLILPGELIKRNNIYIYKQKI